MSNEPDEESLKDVMDRMEAMTTSFLDQIGAHIADVKANQ